MQSPNYRQVINLYSDWLGKARHNQLSPKGEWDVWLILAGRGWGKTLTGAMDCVLYALRNPDSIVAVVVPTFGDLRRVAFDGVSGILRQIPRELLLTGRGKGYNVTGAEISLFNGSKIIGFSATEPDRLRGSQFHRAWCDELCAWFYPDAYDQLLLGLRLGDTPQCVITTTPKPTNLLKSIMNKSRTVITRGSTFENEDNLASSSLEMFREKYEGTRLGRQELYAEVLTDVQGALWKFSDFDAHRRMKSSVPAMRRIVTAVDPAVTNSKHSDETGIVTVGKGEDNRYYVLSDCSAKYSPDQWARKCVDEYFEHGADRIVAEVNNGGDLVKKLIYHIDSEVSYKDVRATRGKMVRAEPISALYEQGKVSHVGSFPILENQLCTYTGESGSKSPDRLDALVWGLTELSQSSGVAKWRIS